MGVKKGNQMFSKKLAYTLLPLTAIGVASYAVVEQSKMPTESVNRLVENKNEAVESYIIKAKNYEQLLSGIRELGIEPSHELPIINSVAVSLTKTQLAVLKKRIQVTVHNNSKVSLASARNGGSSRFWQPMAEVATVIDADFAHFEHNFGDAVTIAFLDTGLDQLAGLNVDLYGNDKAWGTYDAINNTLHNYDDELSGHGTHVASVANNGDFDIFGRIYGVAPNAATVGIKAFDGEGKATYADVIRGINWAVNVKDDINLRVLNMSFSGPVQSHYWQDPLNQAVMAAWQAGIVVVASAGNKGPDPMSIGVPGNVPYIITVGAMTDSYSYNSKEDDRIASFSAAGPTYEAFVKPEIVAPGGHISGLMSLDSKIVQEHPEYHDGGRYFEMSGTSQAASVVSGVVALMLTKNPALTPDQIKCKLIASARPALTADNKLAYSVFQQGAGVVNAYDAIYSNADGCANQGMNIAKDLAGEEHYIGNANIDDNGDFYVEGLGQRYVWQHNKNAVVRNGEIGASGLIWKTNVGINGLIWKTNVNIDGLIWKTNLEVDGLIWKTNLGTNGLIWKTNADFTSQETIEVNNWVTQE